MGRGTRIPVTVLSGYLGAGKTTLVNHLLHNPGDRDIAVVVNDMGEVNVDADLVEREHGDGVVDLSNGCICCRLQGDLLTETRRLAEEREFDYLLVEASGISEPVPIARTFTEGTADGDIDPTDHFRLDTMVSVVDTYGFWKELDPDVDLPEAARTDVERSLADVVVDQVEFCDVLLLNKCDMVPDDELDGIEALVRRLQPRADIHRTVYSEIDPGEILDTGSFDFETARQSAGWKRELAGGHDHDHDHDEGAAARHGVESFVYERGQPFHPERLADWTEEWRGEVVRAKGVLVLASRPGTVMGFHRAGPDVEVGPIGEWDPERDDPRTRLVFIGRGMDRGRIVGELDECLATDTERDAALRDPFPT